MGSVLERNGLVVYTDPVAHIPEEDLKLSLGKEGFADFLDFMQGRTKPEVGFYPKDVREFLQRHSY